MEFDILPSAGLFNTAAILSIFSVYKLPSLSTFKLNSEPSDDLIMPIDSFSKVYVVSLILTPLICCSVICFLIFNSILEKVTDRLDRYFMNKNIEFSTIELKSNVGFENKDINFVIELYLADGIHLKDMSNMPSNNEIIETVKQWVDEYLNKIP